MSTDAKRPPEWILAAALTQVDGYVSWENLFTEEECQRVKKTLYDLYRAYPDLRELAGYGTNDDIPVS